MKKRAIFLTKIIIYRIQLVSADCELLWVVNLREEWVVSTKNDEEIVTEAVK